MRRAVALSILAVGLLGSPSTLYAQALGTIAGVVKDASDAVLPGVTVEASSPALIEKTRSVVTDGRGQFTMVNLPPGTYGVSFNFPGFATVSRQAIDVSVGVTVTVNITMRVGGVAETVTVTGQTPVVDLQSTAQTTVANARAFKELPTGGSWVNMAQIRLFALLRQHLFPARRLDEPAELQPRDLRPGFLDAEEADVSRGTPARLPERIGRRVHRDAGSLAAEQERGLSGSEGRPELEGREPADQRRVRPVGKRQDSHQGEA